MANTKEHYVYCLFRPWNGEPCYIGKGKGVRYKHHAHLAERHTNKHMASIFAKAKSMGLEVPVVILFEGLDDDTAIEFEKAWIAALGRQAEGGPLANLGDGGEGPSGIKRSAEWKKNTSEHQKRLWQDPEYRDRLIQARKEAWTEEARRQHSERVKSRMDDGRRAEISRRNKLAWESEEYRKRQSDNLSKRWASLTDDKKSEVGARLKSSLKRSRENLTPEQKAELSAKLSASTRRYNASLTPEQKAEIVRKRLETRRRNKEAVRR